MRRTSTIIFCFAAICLAGNVLAQHSSVPDGFDPFERNPSANNPYYQPQATESSASSDGLFLLPGSMPSDMEPQDPFDQLRQSELSQLLQRITKAKRNLASDDAEEQKQATIELEAAVTELFELRAKERLKQIEELEQRIAKLREQMERREEKKSEIIQLQVQTHINQANGLGF